MARDSGSVGFWIRAACAFVVAVVSGCTSDGSGGRGLGADGGLPGSSPALAECAQSGGSCGDGEQCEPFKGCVQCLFDTDCGAAQRCSGNVCEDAVTCETNSDCTADAPSDPTCDIATGRCVECVDDKDCSSSSSKCVDRKCVATDHCSDSTQCTDGLCDTSIGQCVECLTDTDCSAGAACAVGQCAKKCQADLDCKDLNQVCDTGDGHCAQCIKDDDCPSTYNCQSERCVVDVCSASFTRCDDTGTGIVTCNTTGDSADFASCGANATCTVTQDTAICTPWICIPGQGECNETAVGIKTCNADGLGYGDVVPCGDGLICAGGACITKVCDPGANFCRNGELAKCNATGTGVSSQSPCPYGNYCSDADGGCVPQVCSPGSTGCNGNTIATCLSDGSGYDAGTPCGTNEACDPAYVICRPIVCTASAVTCVGGTLHTCNSSGTVDTTMNCASYGQVCDDLDGTGACATVVCTPGTPLCTGTVLSTCNSLGTGAVPGGTDCSLSGQGCYAGACQSVVCSGTTFCQNGDVYQCLNGGTSSALYDDCSTSEYCSPSGSFAYCQARVCTPGTQACNGNVLSTCNTDGSGYLPGGTDCSLSNSACVSGSCLPIICTPNAEYCQNGSVYLCGSQGVSSSLYSTCASYQYCYQYSSTYAYCEYDLCTSGQAMCDGNRATTCATDGSGPNPTGGTDCTLTGQACDTGQCLPIVCPKNEYFCNAGNVDLCNASGTSSYTYYTCAASEYCKDSGTTADCVPDICTQSSAGCNGEILATCNADGSGFTGGTTNCATQNKVCNESAACSSSALDTFGSATYSGSLSSGYMVGNELDVRTTRTLTQIETYLTVSGTSIFTWVVYEADALTPTYFTKIFEKATSGSGTATFQSSGAISLQLQAGKRYFIGVMVTGGTATYWEGTAYQDAGSFATVTAGDSDYGGSVAPTSNYFYGYEYAIYERLTTTL